MTAANLQTLHGIIEDYMDSINLMPPTIIPNFTTIQAPDIEYWQDATMSNGPTNGGKTFTKDLSAGGWAAARALAEVLHGRYFFSAVPTFTDDIRIGLCTRSSLDFSGAGIGYSTATGEIIHSNAAVDTMTVIGSGGVLDCALVLEPAASWVAFRVNGGDWMGDPACNPTTGAGCIDISAWADSANGNHRGLSPGCMIGVQGDSVTFNFGASAYTHAPPSGFGNFRGIYGPQ